MTQENIPTEQKVIGMELHTAQVAIHAGRSAIKDIFAVWPIDEDALSQQKQSVNNARRQVTELEPKLNAVKLDQAGPKEHYMGWLKY